MLASVQRDGVAVEIMEVFAGICFALSQLDFFALFSGSVSKPPGMQCSCLAKVPSGVRISRGYFCLAACAAAMCN